MDKMSYSPGDKESRKALAKLIARDPGLKKAAMSAIVGKDTPNVASQRDESKPGVKPPKASPGRCMHCGCE